VIKIHFFLSYVRLNFLIFSTTFSKAPVILPAILSPVAAQQASNEIEKSLQPAFTSSLYNSHL
jgi:hypothetical protein